MGEKKWKTVIRTLFILVLQAVIYINNRLLRNIGGQYNKVTGLSLLATKVMQNYRIIDPTYSVTT